MRRGIFNDPYTAASGRGLIKRAFAFHDLRHWYAVDYLRRGGNIYDLQLILGHSSIKTTELYLNYLTPDEQMTAKFGPAQTRHSNTGSAPS